MNKTVELVKQWGAFEEKHPGGSIEDFCRYLLIHRREKESKDPLVGGVVPWHSDGLLLKIIGRIHKLNSFYANIALEGTGINQIEEFGMLLTIQLQKNPRKTEVIYSNLFELSSGTDMLNRMKKRGFIAEYADKEDRRSKRLRITAGGQSAIEKAKARVSKMAQMMMHDVSEDDKQLCIQLLKNTEIKFSSLWLKHKGKTFEEIYKELVPDSKGKPQKRVTG